MSFLDLLFQEVEMPDCASERTFSEGVRCGWSDSNCDWKDGSRWDNNWDNCDHWQNWDNCNWDNCNLC